jgi:hypothetical protein
VVFVDGKIAHMMRSERCAACGGSFGCHGSLMYFGKGFYISGVMLWMLCTSVDW